MTNKLPSRTIEVPILQNTYTVKYPTVRQTWDIEANKAIFSKQQYGAMIDSQTIKSMDALSQINMAAYFTVLIPQLIKDMKMDIGEMNPIDAKPLMDAFTKVLLPWLNEWDEIIKAPVEQKSNE